MEKSFSPKPLTPGASITWTHFFPDGHTTERTGVVWSRGPAVPGAAIVCWVAPDVPLLTDVYSVVAVGKATSRTTAVHGQYLDVEGHRQWASKGDLYSSNYVSSPLGSLMQHAADQAHRTRQDRVA